MKKVTLTELTNKWVCLHYLCHCSLREAIPNPCDEPHPTGECFVSPSPHAPRERCTRNDNIQLSLHEYLISNAYSMKY